jgi:hypothetical protein
MWCTFGWNVYPLSLPIGKRGRKLGFEAGDWIRLQIRDREIVIRNMDIDTLSEEQGSIIPR